mmetsp:Transcript_8204/g.29893  ORF Transcript_8204/g.29893 Transcript_8204/m.29893 type:complete len:112 (+) Transcript_8204:5146-5481(+)
MTGDIAVPAAAPRAAAAPPAPLRGIGGSAWNRRAEEVSLPKAGDCSWLTGREALLSVMLVPVGLEQLEPHCRSGAGRGAIVILGERAIDGEPVETSDEFASGEHANSKFVT